MNSRQFVSALPLGPGDPRANLLYARLLVSYFAEHVYFAELANGVPVHDATDFSKFCREVIAELRKIGQFSDSTEVSLRLESRTSPKVMPPPPQRRWGVDQLGQRMISDPDPHACSDCFHVHEQRNECGFYLGEGKFCHCPSKVAA